MIGWLRDAPDWVTGPLLVAGAWTGIAYGGLAPRAMEQDSQEEILPACLSRLNEAQNAAIDDAERRAVRDEEYARDVLRSELNDRLGRLREMKAQAAYYETVIHIYRQSGMEKFFPLSLAELPSTEEIEAAEKAALEKLKTLDLPIRISFRRVPDKDLLEQCTCAAATALSGKRMAYALSLASFRIVSPAEIEAVKSDIGEILTVDTCGSKPWETY